MRLNPHLSYNGQCGEAFRFYERSLGGKIVLMMTYGDSPLASQTPPAWHDRVIHATLSLGDDVLTGADAFPDRYRKPRGFSVLLNIGAPAEAERIFATLAENGAVQMPLQETFWAQRFGMLTDRFGIPWMINCGKSE